MWIKKEQLQELQAEFNTKAIIGNKRVYIINHAERLNASSANSILKFLEEPDNNLVAILLTDNIYSVLPTIRSRCQILRLKETQIKKNANYLETLKTIIFKTNEINEENELQINKTIDFVNYYEKNHLTTLLYLNKIWNDYIKTKEDFLNAYQIMLLYYKDILNFKLNKNLEIFSSNENIKEISNHNTINEICQKINIIIKLSDNIKYNANTNLLMDKLIISLEGGI
jgi:DNA polymerase-3 subunit delta'